MIKPTMLLSLLAILILDPTIAMAYYDGEAMVSGGVTFVREQEGDSPEDQPIYEFWRFSCIKGAKSPCGLTLIIFECGKDPELRTVEYSSDSKFNSLTSESFNPKDGNISFDIQLSYGHYSCSFVANKTGESLRSAECRGSVKAGEKVLAVKFRPLKKSAKISELCPRMELPALTGGK
jgi:hypothetical protein